MQCDEFVALLQNVLDRRARPERDARLTAHADSCESCQRLLRGQELLLKGIRSAGPIEAPASMPMRVMSRMQVEPCRNQRRHPWILVPVSLAALAASWLIFLIPLGGKSGSLPAAPAESKIPAAAISTGPAPLPVATTAPDGFMEGENDPWLLNELLNRLTETSLDPFEPVDQIAGGLRPIATSLNVALDTLWRTFPPRKPVEADGGLRDSAGLFHAGAAFTS